MAFNLKNAEKNNVLSPHEKRLQNDRDELKLLLPAVIVDKLLDAERKDKDSNKPFEGILENARSGSEDVILEKQIDDHKVSDGLPKRTGKDDFDQIPINLKEEVSDKQREKAYRAYNTKDASTEMWDELLGVKIPKQPQSQLQNSTDRFKNLTEKDVLENRNVRKMVMASVQDADAMIFFIHHQASCEKRDITKKEQYVLDGISFDKKELLERLFQLPR